MDQERNNHSGIDILRGIAIIAVIVLHVCGQSARIGRIDSTMILFRAVFSFSQFAVPLFIFISGFTLSMRYERGFSLKDFYKNRFKNIIPPYIIFSLIYMSFPLNPFKITAGILYSSAIKLLSAAAFIHLWYIILIVEIYFFYPAIRRLAGKYKESLFHFVILSIIVQIVWIFLRSFISVICREWRAAGDLNQVVWQFSVEYLFFSHIAYFMLGLYFQKNYEAIIHSITKAKKYYLAASMILLSVILSYIHVNDLFWKLLPAALSLALFFDFPVIILLFNAAEKMKSRHVKTMKILEIFGQFSFGIYLVHILISFNIERLLNYFNINYNCWYYYIICIILTAVLSLTSVYIISIFPFHQLIIGKVRYRGKIKVLN